MCCCLGFDVEKKNLEFILSAKRNKETRGEKNKRQRGRDDEKEGGMFREDFVDLEKEQRPKKLN